MTKSGTPIRQNISHTLGVLCILFMLSSCSTYKTTNLNVLLPPDVTLAQLESIVTVDNTSENNTPQTHQNRLIDISSSRQRTKREKPTELAIGSTSNMVTQAFYSAFNTPSYIANRIITEKNDQPMLTPANIDMVFDTANIDAIVLLNELNYRDTLSTFHYNYYKTGEQELKIITQSTWVVYYADASSRSFKYTINDTLYWTDSNIDRADCIMEAMWMNGEKAGNKITPYWKTVTRVYNSGENQAIKSAELAVTNNEWTDAATIWMRIYNGNKKNTKQKARMAFNMALYFEINNNFDTAMEWLTIAENIFLEKQNIRQVATCQMYKKILLNRVKHKSRLDLLFSERTED